MKYVALLSGGKDSCFNLLHCHKNGHELVAAASLGPGPGKDELDSFMYQTVGQDAIEYIAQALDVPLHRKIITGSAVEQGLEYGGRKESSLPGISGDETEDLYDLLSTVKSHHPDIEGVSVGAILSNYQRVRVEHVCRRLSLTPLCYLWQRDQTELLSEMIEAGLEAILIKVAGIGLKPAHLGKTLAEMQPTLLRLNEQYGSHVCGEGGEYETLTLNSPMFKSRIELTETETVIHSDNDFATVAYLRVKQATLKSKEDITECSLRVPKLLDEDYESALQIKTLASSPTNGPKLQDAQAVSGDSHAPITARQTGPWVCIGNIQRNMDQSPGDIALDVEVRECFEQLKDRLQAHGLTFINCTHINVLISSMDLFGGVNTVYGECFGVSPPSRACVAADLPAGIRVRLECLAYREQTSSDRQALHVQGLSYWAPANIGPYSQAVKVRERIFISGQIGLIPSKLAMPSPQSLALETALACQHAKRVIDGLRGTMTHWAETTQCNIYWIAAGQDVNTVKQIHTVITEKLGESLEIPTFFAVVTELPKGALVEKQVLYHTGCCTITDEYGDVSTETGRFSLSNECKGGGDSALQRMASVLEETNEECSIYCYRGQDPGILSEIRQNLAIISDSSISVRVFYVPSRSSPSKDVITYISSSEVPPPTTYIPCRAISTLNGEWDCVICVVR
ncbi:hypothetical protein HGRIS_009473 [Hohenbuehelia grisea]|uniref:Diphthine--ammonia ligase n=1 Tax=Hohenbuehelia grisea TaxID=104357 RepID=A0ABR3J1P0_9AGAR